MKALFCVFDEGVPNDDSATTRADDDVTAETPREAVEDTRKVIPRAVRIKQEKLDEQEKQVCA